MDRFDYELTAQIILSQGQQAIETPQGGNLQISNPFIQLTVPFLKTTQSFSVSVIIFGIKNDIDTKFQLELKDETTDNSKIISEVTGEIPKMNLESISSLNLNIDFRNVILENEGKHSATFLIGGREITKTNFYVVINEVS